MDDMYAVELVRPYASAGVLFMQGRNEPVDLTTVRRMRLAGVIAVRGGVECVWPIAAPTR